MGLCTGPLYLERLRTQHANVYYRDRPIDVLADPRFQPTAHAVAQFYDFQNMPGVRDVMTFETDDGERAGMAFLEPRSKEDLKRKATAYALWADVTCGYMGRSPDYMNTAFAWLGMVSSALGQVNREWERRARALYLNARRLDLNSTHTFTHLFKRTSPSPAVQTGDELALAGVRARETSDGLRLNGSRALATLAPYSHVNFDFINESPGPPLPRNFKLWYIAPRDLPGVRWLCRDLSSSSAADAASSPLAGRLDEMDCIAIFEDCLIPWDAIVAFGPLTVPLDIVRLMMASLQHHVLVRFLSKARFVFGLAHLVAEHSGVNAFVNVQEKLGDMLVNIRALEALAVAAVESPAIFNGYYFPSPDILHAATTLANEFHTRAIANLTQIGGSRLMAVPHDEALTLLTAAAQEHLRGIAASARENIRLFRLAHDVGCSSWGARQVLYEAFHFGDVTMRKCGAYLSCDKAPYVSLVRRILEDAPTAEQPFPVGMAQTGLNA